jgi:C-terminal processing protease CtpA/Prc
MAADGGPKRAVDWWESDPYAVGGGLGVILHQQPRNRWSVADVVRGSPAENAGVRAGDLLLEVDE